MKLEISLKVFIFIIIKKIVGELCVPVYITVCSKESHKNHIELNWNDACNNGSTWIGLFEENPTVNTFAIPSVRISIDDHVSGYYMTNIRFYLDELPENWNNKNIKKENRKSGPQCFPYWIASFRDNETMNVNCLKIEPTWMSDNLERLKRIPLHKLFIPGTHNSGSYSNTVINTNFLLRPYQKFVLNQDQDIWTQLVFGVRYLDFRIAYYEPNIFSKSSSVYDRFWINHDVIKIIKLTPLLKDIKKFLDSTYNEVIILDIHRLPLGFTSDYVHNKLIELLQRELNDLFMDYNSVMFYQNDLTIANILSSNKRLIICYPKTVKNVNWLWPLVRQKWADTKKPYELWNYIWAQISLRSTLPRNFIASKSLWAIMGHLTPSTKNVILNNENESVRYLADAVNRNLTKHVEQYWWNNINIIATDYFLGNNIIQLSIESNMKKSENFH